MQEILKKRSKENVLGVPQCNWHEPLQGDSLQDTKPTIPDVCRGCRLLLLKDGGTWEVYPGLVGQGR